MNDPSSELGFDRIDDEAPAEHVPGSTETESVQDYSSGGLVVEDAAANEGGDAIPDLLWLNLLCARAKPPRVGSFGDVEEDPSWQNVREWLSTHDAATVKAAAEQRGENGLTALHFSCRNCPPDDVLEVLLTLAPEVASWPDGFGWLPIHYACASGSDPTIVQALAEEYPESKTVTDGRGRTPLHFALGDKPATPDVVFLLASSGAASFPDDVGMLPLHYACAFGASEEVLLVLTDAYPEAIRTVDRRKRTPLHFALSNAGRKTVPSAVRLLLSMDRTIVNAIGKGPLPLRVLAEYSLTVSTSHDQDDKALREKRESVLRCMEFLLQADLEPTADFFTALQSLPDWLSERAVVLPVVQNLLNTKIAQRFPTFVLMMDFYVLALVIIFYSLNVVDSIKRRFDDDPDNDAISGASLSPLYIGAGYFALREIIQIFSLLSLKVFKLWLYNPSNYLNVLFVALVLTWTVIMHQGTGDRDIFRVGSAVSVTILWFKFLAYLRNMLIEFAVFVGGVFYVVQRLAAFLVSLGVILIAFAQMFVTVFQQSEYCNSQPNDFLPYEIILEETRCDANQMRRWCSFWNSWLGVYTMLLGEVSEVLFEDSGVATALFVIFMFLVVILLANVLIAIVTDSYKVISEQRAAIVFWTNRLDFVAEMDAVANGPWKSKFRRMMGIDDDGKKAASLDETNVFGYNLWNQFMDLYRADDLYDGVFTVDFVVTLLLRMMGVIVIPCWFMLGILTAGWFWPPQLRIYIFTSIVSKHASDSQKEDELRRTQVRHLQQEVTTMRDDLLQELAMDRNQVVQMKSQVAERKMEIATEMKQIKRLVTMMFERQGFQD